MLERTPATASDRALALADLDRAIRLGVPRSREQARDFAEKGRVLLLDRQFQPALDACELALEIDPKDAAVHRHRVGALLELKRDHDAIVAADAALHTGPKSAELLGLRGLARVRCNDFTAAIDDYTLALALEPSASVLYGRRGWAYLISGAAQMALRDFEHAIQLDPATGDFYSGRGSALVAIGNYREAVSDAEESLRRSESEPRLYYSAARILAQAADLAKTERRPRNSAGPTPAQSYQNRSLALLGQAVERIHPNERAAFWRDVVDSDRVFTAIRRFPAYARIAAAAGVHPVP